MSKFNKVIGNQLNPNGVSPITLGHVFSYKFLKDAVALIEAGDKESYEIYKSIKYPPEGATPESRHQAYIYAAESAAALAMAYYDRNLTKSPSSTA